MKKIIALTMVAAMALSASAASFSWGTGAARTEFPTGTIVGDGSAVGYLVYLGNTASESYTISGYTVTDLLMQSKASTIGGLGNGRITSTFANTAHAPLPGTTDTFENGSVFGMYIVKDGWINIAANTYTISGFTGAVTDDGAALSAATFSFNWTQNAAGSAATSGGGWAMVPEPGTASLALAGLALLIRRRK